MVLPGTQSGGGGIDQVELSRIHHRYELLRLVVKMLGIPLFAVPILATVPVARVLAGKETTVTVTISVVVTLTITIAISVAGYLLWQKTKAQRGEIKRLRKRCTELENELEQAQGGP